MGRFFNYDNPVWRVVGHIADMFLLSIFWYLCCIPVFTIGSGTTAMYYVTLKLTSNQEGYTCSSFFRSFKENLKQATLIWLGCLAAGLILGIDFYWSLISGNSLAAAMLPAFVIISVLYCMWVSMMFPLLARCDNKTKTLVSMCFAMTIRNFLPVLTTVIVTAAVFLFGVFVFWPILLVAPGLGAYINSFVFNRILEKYHLNLLDE